MGNDTIGVEKNAQSFKDDQQRSTEQQETSVRQGSVGRKILVIAAILVPILILLAFFIIGAALKGLSKMPDIQKKSRPVLAVMATTAVSDTVQLSVNVQGQSRPRTEIDLVPEVGGKIVSVSSKFISGGIFNKGDILYRIDPSDYNVAVVRAQSAVARAQQVLVREKAESEVARRDWEDLGDGREASDLTLRKPQLLEAEAGLQSAQADLENANIRLRRTAVSAPFNGQVREKFADLGQYVNPGSRLGRIFSTDIAEVRLALSDADIARINLPLAFIAKDRKSAPSVKLSTTIGGQLREWDGKIMRTDAAYDPQTRSMFAIAEVVDPYGKGMAGGNFPLAPGLFVDASIQGKILDNVIIIPRDGLRPENKVYTVNEDGVAKSHDVIVVDTNPSRAVLLDGVNPGELVIISPLEKSQISLKFRVLDSDDPTKILIEPKEDEKEKKEKTEIDLDAAKLKMQESKKAYNEAKKEFVTALKADSKNKKKKKKSKKSKKDKDDKNKDDQESTTGEGAK